MLNGSSFVKDFDMHLFEFLKVDKNLGHVSGKLLPNAST